MKAKARKKRIFLLALNAALVLLALLCLLTIRILAGNMEAQKAAERWQGESSTEFRQISCYLPVDEKQSLNDMYAFRYKLLDALHKAALDIDTDESLFVDAWSAVDKLTVSSSRASGEASVIAVGGEFFQFHPIRLLSGSYISENDLMQDRVLLDEDLAWLLFGGTELTGMSLKINGVPFVVGGVIEREQDFASQKAYTVGQGLYMSYDAYVSLTENEQAITCYELVMPEPVKGFALDTVKTNFTLGRGEALENTGRFGLLRLYKLLGQTGTRSMQAMGLMYPYWENAARCVEDICVILLLAATVFALVPLGTALVYAVRLIRRGKEGLEEQVLPKLKDSAEEAVRVRQRRRWEKQHGLHEKK